MCLIKNKSNQKIGRDNNGIIAGRDIYLIAADGKKLIEYLSPIYKLNNEDNKKDYTEEYINYINSFKELEGYIYTFIFSKKQKKYEFSSNYLKFAQSLLDWIMGIEEFSLEKYNKFCNELKRIYKIDNNDILLKRWNAFGKFFASNISECANIYNEILEDINNLECSAFFLDDILIDGRNILNESEQINNKYILDNPFQKEINKHNRKLTMPIYDRLKADCYENVLKDTFTIETLDENTIMYGNRLNDILNEIQNLIFNAVFYGSITHMRLCRGVIANVMYSYSKIYQNENFYILTLKMLALSGQYKEYKKLCLYLGDSLSFWYSKDYIQDMHNLMNKMLKHEKISYQNFIFGFYGKYLDDDKYDELEKNIYDYLNNIDTINMGITSEIFKNVKLNIMRTKRILELMNIFEKYVLNNFSRFFHEISSILNNIDIDNLNDECYKKYVEIVDGILNNDIKLNLNMSIANILKKNKYTEKFEKYRENPQIKDLMSLDEGINDNYMFVSKMIDDYKKRYNEKEKEPLIIRYPDINYTLSREFFEEIYSDDKIIDLIEKEYIPLILKIFKSDKQTNSFKLEQLKNLLYMISIEEYKVFCEKINDIMNKFNFGFGKENQIINCINYEEIKNSEIELYIGLIKAFINNETNFNDIVTTYIEKYFKNNISLKLLIDCLKVIGISKQDDEILLNQIYFLYLVTIEKDYSTKVQIMELLTIFSNTKYESNILKNMETLSVDCTYDVSRKILNSLRRYEYEKIIPILNILKNNNNINVRILTENYEKDIKNKNGIQ